MLESPDELEHQNVPQNLFQCDLALKFFHLDCAFLDECEGLQGGKIHKNYFAGLASYFLEKE